jgi:hypothetical protein
LGLLSSLLAACAQFRDAGGPDAQSGTADARPGAASDAGADSDLDAGAASADVPDAPTTVVLGSDTATGQYVGLSDGYVYDNALQVPEAVTLLSFHIQVHGSSGTIALGLWATGGGRPSTLVAGSPPLAFVDGEVSWPVGTPVALPAGEYWLGFEKWNTGDGTLSLTENDPSPPETTCDAEWSGTSLPADFPSCTLTTGSPGQAILWIVVQP